METKRAVRGLRSFYVFIPTILLISVFYVFIIVSTIFIDKYTVEIAEDTEESSEIFDIIDDLQSHSSKLSATASSFAYSPTIGGPPGVGTINMALLNAYIEEFTNENKQPVTIKERVSKYNIDDEIMDEINDAIASAIRMIRLQAHSFLLIDATSTIDIPSNYIVTFLNTGTSISSEEIALTDEEKFEKALYLLFSPEYSEQQKIISENLSKSNIQLNVKHLERQNEYNSNLNVARIFLWSSIASILIINNLFFFVLLKKLVFPISRFAKQIELNDRLETEHSLYEANYLALSYNALLDRHMEYENELKTVAEFDSLTGLPNRYCYNEFLKNTKPGNNSSCIFLFDINNLKFVNDTYGHSKGDKLIQNASICIKECFLKENGKNCYRIGGDEFVAILDNIEKEDINKYIDAFIKKQKDLNVSIAFGYSYSDNVSTIGYEKLIIKADKEMYKKKKEMYKDGDNNISR